ncbi:MAG: methyltransferase family protein [Candidatus Heimdallarchaeaceae archaeon]
MLYVYYPEESKIVKHEIYSIVRNPLYVSVILLSFSALVSHLSVYSVGIAIILIIGMNYHSICVEDKELIERFGEDFKKYRKSVPSLLIRPKNWGKFIRFLMGKKI